MSAPERGARSSAVREYLKSNPKAGPKQIVADLHEKGIEVTAGLASSIKYGGKTKKRGANTRRRMAVANPRKEVKTSSSQVIRDYLRQHPRAMPLEIKSGLKKQGIKVSTGLISNVKSQSKKKRRVAPAVRVAARKTRTRKSSVTIEQLIEVKRLANAMGGVDQVRRVLETLEQLR